MGWLVGLGCVAIGILSIDIVYLDDIDELLWQSRSCELAEKGREFRLPVILTAAITFMVYDRAQDV